MPSDSTRGSRRKQVRLAAVVFWDEHLLFVTVGLFLTGEGLFPISLSFVRAIACVLVCYKGMKLSLGCALTMRRYSNLSLATAAYLFFQCYYYDFYFYLFLFALI